MTVFNAFASLGSCTVVLATLATPGASSGRAPDVQQKPHSFAVYMLSRGHGVPDATRQAFAATKSLLEAARTEGKANSLQVEVIGLEGERRVCVEFADRVQADLSLERIRALSREVELFNVVEEACSPESGDLP